MPDVQLPYASTVIAGALGTDDVLAGKKMRDVTKGLFGIPYQNDKSPLLAWISRSSFGRGATNPKKEWSRKDLHPRYDTVAGTISNNGTAAITFAPTNPSWIPVDTEIEFLGVSGNINHAVITTNNGTTVVATSIDGSTTLPTIAAGTDIHILSRAAGAESTIPNTTHVKDTQEYNYPQFLRYPSTLDIYQLDQAQYTGMEEKERIDEDMLRIKMAFEILMFRGARAKRTHASDGAQFFVGGLDEFVTDAAGDNILDWSSGLTEAQWREWLLEGPCKFGSNTKLLFTGSQFYMQLEDFEIGAAQNRKRFGPTNTVMGISFEEYRAPGGKRLLINHHNLFDGPLDTLAYIVDPKYVKLYPYGRNKPFSFHEGIEANDFSGKTNEWRILATIEFGRMEPHGKIFT